MGSCLGKEAKPPSKYLGENGTLPGESQVNGYAGKPPTLGKTIFPREPYFPKGTSRVSRLAGKVSPSVSNMVTSLINSPPNCYAPEVSAFENITWINAKSVFDFGVTAASTAARQRQPRRLRRLHLRTCELRSLSFFSLSLSLSLSLSSFFSFSFSLFITSILLKVHIRKI